jgi:hypothetical protein
MTQKNDHDLIVEIHTILTDPDVGLCQSHKRLKADFYAFRRAVLTILGVLIGSGILSFGIVELVKASAK